MMHRKSAATKGVHAQSGISPYIRPDIGKPYMSCPQAATKPNAQVDTQCVIPSFWSQICHGAARYLEGLSLRPLPLTLPLYLCAVRAIFPGLLHWLYFLEF